MHPSAAAAAPLATPPAPPASVAQYRLRALIGHGSTGAIYLADDTTAAPAAPPIALKLLRPEFATDPASVARFAREIRALAALAGDRVPHLHAFGRTPEGQTWLAMEHVPGESLRALVTRTPRLAPALAVAITRQLAEALAHAHLLGIVHRDLKPENVIVAAPRGAVSVKLLDFGLARLLRDAPSAPCLTARGAVFGTPAYISPEQACGEPVDGRADQYALGVMLYEMLAGRRPFTDEDPLTLLQQHALATPPPLSAIAPYVPPALAAIVARMMARRPADRFASLDHAVRALAEAPLTPPAPASPTDAPPPPSPLASPPSSSPFAAARALPPPWRAGAAVALALGLATLAVVVGR